MVNEKNLVQLASAFKNWRRHKVRRSDPIPKDLLAKARKIAYVQGVNRVAVALTLDPKRLRERDAVTKVGPVAKPVAYSRVELGPLKADQAFVEVESLSGVKIRIFSVNADTLGMVMALWRGQP